MNHKLCRNPFLMIEQTENLTGQINIYLVSGLSSLDGSKENVIFCLDVNQKDLSIL